MVSSILLTSGWLFQLLSHLQVLKERSADQLSEVHQRTSAAKKEIKMTKTVIRIEGMMCGMCESHVNDTVRNTVPAVHEVKSSRKNGETIIITDNVPDESELRTAIEKHGYRVLSVTSEPYEKKGFSLFKKK